MKKIVLILFIFFYFFPQKSFAAIVPTPIDSANDSTTDTARLIWQYSGTCVSSGSCFRVQVASSSAFSPITKDNYTNLTNYTPQLSLQKWYWRVEAKDSTGVWSTWSNIWSFTLIEKTPSPTPTPTPSPTATPSPSASSTHSVSSTPTPTPQSSVRLTPTPIATKIGIDLTKNIATESVLGSSTANLATPKTQKKEDIKTLGSSKIDFSKISMALGIIIILSAGGFYLKSKWIKQ